MTDNPNLPVGQNAAGETPAATIQKWGGIASFVLAAAFILSEMVYFSGNLREANGPLSYALADFLYGPVRAACLVLVIYALRERIGEHAPRRMNLAFLAAVLSALMFVTAAFLRSSNRNYHISHPELNLQESQTVLIVWTTQLAGVIAVAWHFFGWSLVLLGSAGWTSLRLPRGLNLLYLMTGAIALFVYLLPSQEGTVITFGLIVCVWQGFILLKTGLRTAEAIKTSASPADLP